VLDDHFYLSAEDYFNDIHHYDKFDRNGPKIFMGEYATMEGSPTGDFGAALGDAAWLTGVERNSDVVVMSSYAPLLVNVHNGGMQWHPDLIGYDGLTATVRRATTCFRSLRPRWAIEVPESTLTGAGPRVAYSVTKTGCDGQGLSEDRQWRGDAAGAGDRSERHGAITGPGEGDPAACALANDTNTITDPKHIVPVESTIPVLERS
jgi:alpha-N-arabinofuranosidase